jgi:hypothetical protein
MARFQDAFASVPELMLCGVGHHHAGRSKSTCQNSVQIARMPCATFSNCTIPVVQLMLFQRLSSTSL